MPITWSWLQIRVGALVHKENEKIKNGARHLFCFGVSAGRILAPGALTSPEKTIAVSVYDGYGLFLCSYERKGGFQMKKARIRSPTRLILQIW